MSQLLLVIALAASPAEKPVYFVDPAAIAGLARPLTPVQERALERILEGAREGMAAPIEPYTGQSYFELASASQRAAGHARDLAVVALLEEAPEMRAKAKAILLAWATHEPIPGTTPNREAAEGQSWHDALPAMGMCVGEMAAGFVNVYGLLHEYLTPAEHASVRAWFSRLVPEIKAGHQAWIDNGYFGEQDYNNHLSAHLLGLAAIGYALKDEALLAYTFDSMDNPRDYREMIAGAILMPGKPDTQFWKEDKRRDTKPGEIYDRYRVVTIRGGKGFGLGYAMLHLQFLTLIAEAAHHHGGDYFAYAGRHGESLRRAFEHYADYYITHDPAVHGPYHANDRLFAWNLSAFQIALRHYPDSAPIARALAANDPVQADSNVLGYLPALLWGGSEAE